MTLRTYHFKEVNMKWQDFKELIGQILAVALVIFVALLGFKIFGFMFNMPADRNFQASERNIKICVDSSGTPVVDDNGYKECKGAK